MNPLAHYAALLERCRARYACTRAEQLGDKLMHDRDLALTWQRPLPSRYRSFRQMLIAQSVLAPVRDRVRR